MNFHKISWQQYEKDCFTLARKIKQFKSDKIVAISRGGLVAARIFSVLLDLSISHITIESYQNLKKKKYVTITEVPSTHFNNKSILLVDEIGDSGRTLARALSYFKSFNVKKILSLALYVKSKTKPLPDFWAKKIDAWVIFPYEVRETYTAFLKLFKTKEKTREKLLEVGFENWEIDEILKGSGDKKTD